MNADYLDKEKRFSSFLIGGNLCPINLKKVSFGGQIRAMLPFFHFGYFHQSFFPIDHHVVARSNNFKRVPVQLID